MSINVKARINARKVLLVYFYEQYFFDNAANKDSLLTDVERVQKIVANPSEMDEQVDVKEIFASDYYENVDEEIPYIINNYFDKFAPEEIDVDFVMKIAPRFREFEPKVRDLVTSFAVTFGYDEMDLIDRMIFVLGYMEHAIIQTPKEVVLNEMVEISKRYGDDSSSKLINGIGHKLLGGGEGTKPKKKSPQDKTPDETKPDA